MMPRTRWTSALVVSALVAAGATIGAPPASAAAAGSGDQAVAYQMNVAHDGYLSGDALAPPLVRQWSRSDLGGTVSYPLIADGKVFVTVGAPITTNSSPPKWIYALDESTGATVWSHPVNGTYDVANAAYDNGTVYVLNFDGLLQSFNAATGAPGWSLQLPGQYSFTSPPTAANGVVYVAGAGSGGTLYAVSGSSGAVLWVQRLNTADHSAPTLSDTSVFVSDVCNVYAFNQASDQATSAQLWRQYYGCSGGGGKTTVLAASGLYARQVGLSGSNDVLNPAKGDITGHFSAGPAPAFTGSTGFFMNSHTLQAVDPTGTVLWSFAGDGDLDTAPIVVNNDVYVGSSSGLLYAVDTGTGQSAWSTNVGTGIQAPDEYNAQIITGLGAGEGHLLVPAGSTLTAYVPGSADSTPPTVQPAVKGPQGSNGWYTGSVSVTWSVSDPESGIAYSSGCGATTLSSDTAGTTLTCTATDGAGLTSSSSVTVKLDTAAPAISCSSLPAVWSSSDLSTSCQASDGVSGLGSTGDSTFTLSTSVPAGTETSSASTPSRQVCDAAGNCSSAGPYTGLRVDKKAPSITLSAPAAATYTLNQAVSASYSCTDGGSGVATCSGKVANGQPIDTGSVGSKTFGVSAADAVGNTSAPVSVAYSVTYGVCQSSVPTIKPGRTGTVSVQLCDAKGANVSSPSVVLTAAGVYTSAGVKVQSLSNTFSYTKSPNNAGGGYTESVNTSGLATGTYYVAFTAVGDSVMHQAAFTVR